MENQQSISMAISCGCNYHSEQQNIDASKSVGGSAEAEAANDETKTLLDMNGFVDLAALLKAEADLKERTKRKTRSNKRKRHQSCDLVSDGTHDILQQETAVEDVKEIVKECTQISRNNVPEDDLVFDRKHDLLQQESAAEEVKQQQQLPNINHPSVKQIEKVLKEHTQISTSNLPEDDIVGPEERHKQTGFKQAAGRILRSKRGLEDNFVVRQLLRKARYFDPPGEAICSVGHFVHLTARKQKKACYICGNLEHSGKRCPKLRCCRICKEIGHLARDCSEKDNGSDARSIICLKCGNPGHDLFHCSDSYSPDDLKNIRCYICMEIGHLCCVNPPEMRAKEASCYTCGTHGHAGENCMKLRGGDGSSSVPPRLCYKCGEEGHIARKCAKRRKVFYLDALSPDPSPHTGTSPSLVEAVRKHEKVDVNLYQ